MSSDIGPLMSFLSFGSISDKEDPNTFALLLSQESVRTFPNQTIFTFNANATTLKIRKGLLGSTEEPPINLKSDFVIRLNPAGVIKGQPVPPVIIKGNGGSADNAYLNDNQQFTVTFEEDEDNRPKKVSPPIEPFGHEYIIMSFESYGSCEISPGGPEPSKINLVLSPGFSILIEGGS